MTMRASLAAHLARAVRNGEGRRLGLGALRAGAARFDLDLAESWRGPLLATFAITWRCPLACAMCDLPARAGKEIPDSAIPEWIDAIADLSPLGLGFTGGEPLVRRIVFDAIERTARRGIVAHLNTSGIGLGDDNASRLAASGLGSVNVSIDHVEADAHDRLRGRDGALAHALAAIERLARARSAAGTSFRIQVVTAVSRSSLARVGDLQRLVTSRGADALSLLPVHDFASTPSPTTPSAEPVASVPDDVPLENSPAYRLGVARFFAGDPTPGTCSAPRTAVFVDPTGELYACTPGATLGRGGIPATPRTLGAIVRGGALARTVPADQCTRCWWNCHRELDIAIGAHPMAPA